ncbi:MAG: NIPSNAP family protein [Chloroflexi bacterium]|nr:NIPSNAP family protein [Chloroflexota bacterium]
MLYELRQYQTKPGMRDEWVRYMEKTIIPFQVSKGMVIVGSFIDEENPNHYIWIRRFRNEAERVRLYKAVYESSQWVNKIGPKVPDMLVREKSVVTRMIPTKKSVI